MSKFTEAKLEAAIITLLEEQGFPYSKGEALKRESQEVLLIDDLHSFLSQQYASEGITGGEIDSIIKRLQSIPRADLYDSNKTIQTLVANGFLQKREDPNQKDLFIELIDYTGLREKGQPRSSTGVTHTETGDTNIYRIVNQVEIIGDNKRIPDGIL